MTIKVRDRSDANPNVGVVTGRTDLDGGWKPAPLMVTPEPVETASDDLDPKEGNVPCPSGPPPNSGPQAIDKAQKPVTAYPSQPVGGVKATMGGRGRLATGPAVSNPDNSSPTISNH